MSHYYCKHCHQQYDTCSCPSFTRKSLGQELAEASDSLQEKQQKEESAKYWLSVRAQAQKLFSFLEEECRNAIKDKKRTINFGEIHDENVATKLKELCEEEELKTLIHYHEGIPSAYLHDDRASYYWLEISW